MKSKIAKKKKIKKERMVSIPVSLARMLAAQPQDLKNPKEYRELFALSRSLLRVIIEAKGVKV